MTGSAVLDTVLGLVFLYYALALLCSGLVEMISNWVKKRAKYLLRGIRDLLDDVVPVEAMAADRARLQQMPATAQTALLNPRSSGSATTQCCTHQCRPRRRLR
jgi:hypothetical protein